MTENVPHKLVLPLTPRPMTRRITRRSWGESKVRFWWASAAVIVIVMIIVAITEGARELKHRRLLDSGVEVEGIATSVADVTPAMNKNFSAMRDQTLPVEFTVLLPPNYEPTTLKGYLEPAEGFMRINQRVKLRVDPKTLEWTDQLDPKAWWEVLAIPLFLLLPMVLVLMGIAEIRRRMILLVWRDGMRGHGVVVDVRHTAAAPWSRIVHFTLADGRDRRVFKTLWPVKDGVPHRGQELTLIYPPDRPQEAIIADLYSRPGDVQPVGGFPVDKVTT